MSDRPIATITSSTLAQFLMLGIPGTILWGIGGLAALSLMGGLSNGSVTPGVGSSVQFLGIMWGSLVLCAAGGVVLGVASLFYPVRKRVLAFSAGMGFLSLFFTVLT